MQIFEPFDWLKATDSFFILVPRRFVSPEEKGGFYSLHLKCTNQDYRNPGQAIHAQKKLEYLNKQNDI